VIYDSYDPAPAEPTVIYVEQQPSEPYPAVQQGEGQLQPVPEGSAGAAPSAAPEVKQSLKAAAQEYLTKGDAAFREGRYADAVHHYARAAELFPEDGSIYLILSDALFATGDYHYAAFTLRRALEIQPTLIAPVIDKHVFYGDPADFDKQLGWAEAYLNDHFLDEDIRLLLAANYLFSSRPAQAVDMLETSFSTAVRESPAGKLILERAKTAREAKPAIK
jgi:tetratricopeptide (TPR) repeat protein